MGIRLVVGLGNPGKEYERTRHNAGFWLVERFATTSGIALRKDPKFQALVGRHDATGAWLLLPQTFMNLSGAVLPRLFDRFEASNRSLIVVYDDVALPWGMLRVRQRGSAGSHKGLKSIISTIGSREFPRVRMGIRPDRPVGDLAAYVLRPMRKADLEMAAEMTEQATEAVELILTRGIAPAMNRFNRRIAPPDETGDESNI